MSEQDPVLTQIPLELRLSEAINYVKGGLSQRESCKRAKVDPKTFRRLLISFFFISSKSVDTTVHIWILVNQ
jgi:hypothetical protein